jgi:hypothetical protein
LLGSLPQARGVNRDTDGASACSEPVGARVLLRVLRALGLADRVDLLVDQPEVRPLQLVEPPSRTRRRASSTPPTAPEGAWSWGDEG